MAEVLLTHSYFLRFDRKQSKTNQPYPPLATLYAASVLREGGIEVALFDSMLAQSENELIDAIRMHSPKVVAIYDDSFNYLTKMCLGRMRIAAFRMIKIAKQAGCIVAVSTSDSADHVAEYLDRGADFIILGEGERTLLELCDSILGRSNGSFDEIDGLSFQSDNEVVRTKPRRTVANLDELPMPAWDLADIQSYRKCWSSGYFSMNIVTTRGCPYGCNWCAKPVYGRVYNSRSPAKVVAELSFLFRKFAPDHIWFCDDIFGLKGGWLEEFRREVDCAGLKFRYKCLSRPDLLLKDNSFDALAASGCETVWIGAESGSQKILDSMEKGTTVDQIRLATRQLKWRGIRVGYFLQFGFPGESFADVNDTLKMVKQEMPDEIGISVSYPLPSTKFHAMVKNRLGEKQNWFDSDDIALLFPGEFRPAFYRILHKVVHRLHRIRRIVSGSEKWKPRSIAALAYGMLSLPVYLIGLQLMRRRNPNRISLGLQEPNSRSGGEPESIRALKTS